MLLLLLVSQLCKGIQTFGDTQFASRLAKERQALLVQCAGRPIVALPIGNVSQSHEAVSNARRVPQLTEEAQALLIECMSRHVVALTIGHIPQVQEGIGDA